MHFLNIFIDFETLKSWEMGRNKAGGQMIVDPSDGRLRVLQM